MVPLLAARPAAAAAAANADALGGRMSRRTHVRMRMALDRLQNDALQYGPDDRRAARIWSGTPSATDQPNVVADFSAVVDAEQSRRDLTRESLAPTRMSLDAIGAAARETLFPPGAETSFDPGSESVVLGALVSALSIAGEIRLNPRELPAPWEVAHPDLLDPVMWLIGTAYVSVEPLLARA